VAHFTKPNEGRIVRIYVLLLRWQQGIDAHWGMLAIVTTWYCRCWVALEKKAISKLLNKVPGHHCIKSFMVSRIEELILIPVEELQSFTAECVLSAWSLSFSFVLLSVTILSLVSWCHDVVKKSELRKSQHLTQVRNPDDYVFIL